MSKVKDIESRIKEISSEEWAAFPQWFADFGAEAWDRQLEADVKAGKVDGLAAGALQEHADGRSKQG
jgi:hypothetical protein